VIAKPVGRLSRATYPCLSPCAIATVAGSGAAVFPKAGTISFDGSGIDCLVRKMSGEGANLEVESQIGIPSSFELVIDTEHSNHHCHVVWRKARRIGIAFD
jgi:hypothetical protein